MMNDDQKQRVSEAMQAYEFYEQYGISQYKSIHIQSVGKVRKELGLTVSVCKGCLDEVHQYMKVIYALYKS